MSAAAVGYRPPNWGQQPQLYSMTCTLPANTTAANNPSTSPTTNPQPTTFYFDAVPRVDHVQEQVMTEQPVQAGPALVDHVYQKPARVSLEVRISDAMQSYQSGQYSGSSRSVAAFQQFLAIAAARVPITLSTRLNTYQNMGLEIVRATETNETFSALRAVLDFKQIPSAQVPQPSVSARPDTTNTTQESQKSTEPLSPDVQNLLNGIMSQAPQN